MAGTSTGQNKKENEHPPNDNYAAGFDFQSAFPKESQKKLHGLGSIADMRYWLVNHMRTERMGQAAKYR